MRISSSMQCRTTLVEVSLHQFTSSCEQVNKARVFAQNVLECRASAVLCRFTVSLSVESRSLWRMPHKFMSIATCSNILLDQIKTKNQKTKTKPPLVGEKLTISNQTGSKQTMSKLCNGFTSNNSSSESLAQSNFCNSFTSNNCSTQSLAQPTLNSGPSRTVTVTTHASPAPLAATRCHTTNTIQRSNLGRPSAEAAHAACVRASALQQENKSVELSRKAAVPSQSARRRAVSRHHSAAEVKTLSADFKLTQDLLTSLTIESAEGKCSGSQDPSRS